MSRIETRSFSLALSSPLETARGAIEAREGLLVRVVGEDGEGVGEATPLPGWTESRAECEAALERAREKSEDPERALRAVSGTPAARHGLSLALADRDARAAGEPLYTHLGSSENVDRVPVNATVGDGEPEETAEEAAAAVRQGFSCCKLKVGAGSLEHDLARVRRVREAIGPDPTIRLDANGAWSGAEASRAIDALSTEIDLLEQPLPAAELVGHAALRGRGVEIAIDEGLYDSADGIEAVIDAGAADAVIVKPMAVGGVDAGIALANRAFSAELTPIVTTTIDAVLARTAAVHLAAAIPVEEEGPAHGLATADRLESDLAADPVRIEEGAATVPQGPGLGVAETWGELDG